MYHALHACARHTPAPTCGFIHIPYLPQQVALLLEDVRDSARVEQNQRADLCSMPLDVQVAGVRLAIETTLEVAGA